MIIPRHRLAFLALLLGVLAPGAARAQEELRIGGVRVDFETDTATGADLGFAVLKPDSGGARHGELAWACGGDPAGLAASIRLPRGGRTSQTRPAVWRVDGGAADTAFLRGDDKSGLWMLRPEDTGALRARARTPGKLVVRVPGFFPDEGDAEYAYALAGLDPALVRLGCAGAPRGDGEAAGLATLRRLVAYMPGADTTVYELGVVEHPSLVNGAAVGRTLQRQYPPLLRDAGVSGEVHLRFIVTEIGEVDSTSISIERSTHPVLDTAAVQVLKIARFHPARANGGAVRVWAVLPISFQIWADAPAPAPPASPPARDPRRRRR